MFHLKRKDDILDNLCSLLNLQNNIQNVINGFTDSEFFEEFVNNLCTALYQNNDF